MIYVECFMLMFRKHYVVFDRLNSGLVVILARFTVDYGYGF